MTVLAFAGPRCLGTRVAKGCGGPRTEHGGDSRLRFLCARCAERAALKLGLAGPAQIALDIRR